MLRIVRVVRREFSQECGGISLGFKKDCEGSVKGCEGSSQGIQTQDCWGSVKGCEGSSLGVQPGWLG